jgi:hypothetical protein
VRQFTLTESSSARLIVKCDSRAKFSASSDNESMVRRWAWAECDHLKGSLTAEEFGEALVARLGTAVVLAGEAEEKHPATLIRLWSSGSSLTGLGRKARTSDLELGREVRSWCFQAFGIVATQECLRSAVARLASVPRDLAVCLAVIPTSVLTSGVRNVRDADSPQGRPRCHGRRRRSRQRRPC